MRNYVVIATKGRPREIYKLLDYLQRQTLQPAFTVLVGTQASDLEGIEKHPWLRSEQNGIALISPRIGATSQRNVGLEALEQRGFFADGPFFCTFFDDDYRMADDWLERAAERFTQGGIVGLTGQVLADGVRLNGLNEEQADAYLAGKLPPQPHWAAGIQEADSGGSVYGCNMAFTHDVIRQTRFDENLPLYGWQEDRDYTGSALKFGRVIYYPHCKGVHLGIKSARVSGVKFGYSQIANPLYLMSKGTMEFKIGIKFLAKALAANMLYSVRVHPYTDYRGRLLGNIKAILDMALLRLHPLNIKKLQ